MEPIQIIALITTVAHVGLLTGVYVADTGQTHHWQNDDAFVSTSLDRLIFFKICLTMIVVFEAHICATYIYFSHPPLPCYHLSIAVVAILVALAGWTTVACTHMGEPAHQAGTVLFLLGSATYSAFLLSGCRRWGRLYALLWTLVAACAVAFVATNLAQNYPVAAFLEWLAFALQGLVLVIYFYDNPLKERRDTNIRLTSARGVGSRGRDEVPLIRLKTAVRCPEGEPYCEHDVDDNIAACSYKGAQAAEPLLPRWAK